MAANDRPTIGPTGEFPEGKLGPRDDGEIGIAVYHTKGKVILAFGVEISWLGMSPDLARRVGQTMIHIADEIEGGRHHDRPTS